MLVQVEGRLQAKSLSGRQLSKHDLREPPRLLTGRESQDGCSHGGTLQIRREDHYAAFRPWARAPLYLLPAALECRPLPHPPPPCSTQPALPPFVTTLVNGPASLVHSGTGQAKVREGICCPLANTRKTVNSPEGVHPHLAAEDVSEALEDAINAPLGRSLCQPLAED